MSHGWLHFGMTPQTPPDEETDAPSRRCATKADPVVSSHWRLRFSGNHHQQLESVRTLFSSVTALLFATTFCISLGGFARTDTRLKSSLHSRQTHSMHTAAFFSACPPVLDVDN